jgi:hypothetical protein
MRPRVSPLALLILSASVGLSETRHFAIGCGELNRPAATYLKQHGLMIFPSSHAKEAMVGRDAARPWTDADGKLISDFQVYWSYAQRKGADRPPFGVWRLRLAHYRPDGKIESASEEGGCVVEFRLRFETSGANMVTILGVDSIWGYASNGRLEREYLDGISAELSRRK